MFCPERTGLRANCARPPPILTNAEPDERSAELRRLRPRFLFDSLAGELGRKASTPSIVGHAMNSALERAVSVMSDIHAPWGVAGGCALDLFIGHESRSHADIDIAILRADQQQLRSQLSGRVEKVVARQLATWLPTEILEPPVHEVHVTWPDGYCLEFLLNEQDCVTREWVFRRDGRIRRSLAATFSTDREVPYLAPEIVLLYKAKAPSATDDGDFHTVLSHLQADRRSWLRQALDLTAPGHRWANILSREA